MINPTGIILSISIIAALTTAVASNPQIQAWLEEQRQTIAELLRQIGQELDPESRRAAEAFAYEGRTVVNDEGLAREARGSSQAAALATGRRLSSPSTIRRVPKFPAGEKEAEERRAKGREYLERRKMMMEELQRKRSAAAREGVTPPSPTFDELVDEKGHLRGREIISVDELPEVSVSPLSEKVVDEMKQVERHLARSIPAAEPVAAASGWSWGSAFANPFGDEYALDLERSTTPKPPVPPKIQLERERVSSRPIYVSDALNDTISTEARQEQQVDRSALSYEEQLAIALSLSEQESSNISATVRQHKLDHNTELEAAIAASLRDMDGQEAAHAIANAQPVTPKPRPADAQPLVDLTPTTDVPTSASQLRRNEWAELFDPRYSPSQEPLSLTARSTGALSEDSDDLYRTTPQLTKARLASHNAIVSSGAASCPLSFTSPIAAGPQVSQSNSNLPFDPVREAVAAPRRNAYDMESSFYSAHEPSPAPSSVTFDGEPSTLLEIAEDTPQQGQRTPTSHAHSSLNLHTESSDSETFASVSVPASKTASRAESRTESQASYIEVIDLAEDSDVDMLSEEGDGIATPDSWSEVGSRDGESEAGEQQVRS